MTPRPENDTNDRRMRTCESCGVGIGIMGLREFAARFVCKNEPCPTCGGVVLPDEEPKVLDDWITAEVASHRYPVQPQAVREAASKGLLERKKNGRGYLVLSHQVGDLVAEGMLGGS